MLDGSEVTKTVKYDYDYQNRRVEKKIETYDETGKKVKTAEKYTYQAHDIVLRTDKSGDLTNRYLHGPAVDQVLADENIFDYNEDEETTNVLRLLSDNLHSIRDIIDYDETTGECTTVNSISYGAFGTIVVQTNPTITTIYGYTSQETNPESEFMHFDARPYSPYLQTFASTDPIGFAANDVNLYRYVGNNPTNFTDPTGMQDEGAYSLPVHPIPQFMPINSEFSDQVYGPIPYNEPSVPQENPIKFFYPRIRYENGRFVIKGENDGPNWGMSPPSVSGSRLLNLSDKYFTSKFEVKAATAGTIGSPRIVLMASNDTQLKAGFEMLDKILNETRNSKTTFSTSGEAVLRNRSQWSIGEDAERDDQPLWKNTTQLNAQLKATTQYTRDITPYLTLNASAGFRTQMNAELLFQPGSSGQGSASYSQAIFAQGGIVYVVYDTDHSKLTLDGGASVTQTYYLLPNISQEYNVESDLGINWTDHESGWTAFIKWRDLNDVEHNLDESWPILRNRVFEVGAGFGR